MLGNLGENFPVHPHWVLTYPYQGEADFTALTLVFQDAFIFPSVLAHAWCGKIKTNIQSLSRFLAHGSENP